MAENSVLNVGRSKIQSAGRSFIFSYGDELRSSCLRRMISTNSAWSVAAWGSRVRDNSRLQCDKNKNESKGGKKGRKPCGAQWVLPSSKDSTPESQVVAASFSCRLLMISWSSEPELLWRPKTEKEGQAKVIQTGEGRGRKQSREADTNSWLDAETQISNRTFISCCFWSDWASLPTIYWASLLTLSSWKSEDFISKSERKSSGQPEPNSAGCGYMGFNM